MSGLYAMTSLTSHNNVLRLKGIHYVHLLLTREIVEIGLNISTLDPEQIVTKELKLRNV